MWLLPVLAVDPIAGQTPSRRPPASATPFTTPLTVAEMTNKPAVVQTAAGSFAIHSMAHGDDPACASTSFFIVTADAPSLDGKYTVFGRVIDGLDVLERIESTPVSGESPTTRIDLVKVRVVG